MSTVVQKNQAWAVEIESAEGTYTAPTAAASFVQTLADGTEMSRKKDTLERNVFTTSIGKSSPRTGQFSASGTMPVEARAHSTEGHAPEYDALMRSALGSRHQITTAITTGTGNTASVLQVATASSVINVGDILMVKEAGRFHVSPVKAVTSSTVELQFPATAAFSDHVVIAKSTTYGVADSGHPALSISRYLESSVVQFATGCKVSALSLADFSTGKIPSFEFKFEGLNFDSQLQSIPFQPSYDNQLPPIVLSAMVLMDGQALDINELAVSLENTLGYKSSVLAENGKVSSRATERAITGTMNPYMASDSMANFEKFKSNTPFSIFAYAKLPSVNAGEFSGVVAIYLPNCVITELGESDAEGILQDSISFSANRGTGGNIPEIYIALI